MALSTLLSIAIIDDAGNRDTHNLFFAATLTKANIESFLALYAPLLDNITGGVIESATITEAVALPAGLKAAVVADSLKTTGVNAASIQFQLHFQRTFQQRSDLDRQREQHNALQPLGTGLAFAHKYREDGGINYCYFGDGAVNQGQVYEAFNMASLWKLPIIYVIENNKYGMGTSVERASATTELYKRGEVFGIPGMPVDGMNVIEVKKAADQVVAHVRGGNGPYVMEMNTYRYRGHSMSDPAKYRTKEEVSSYRKERDPIDALRSYMEENGMGDEASFKNIDREIKDIINQAAEFAQSSPEPDPSELWTDVLVEA